MDIFSLDRQGFEEACKAEASGLGSPTARILGGLATLHMPEDDDGIAAALTRDGFWESWISLATAKLVEPGMHCWNIGANCGYFAALMALRAGEKGLVMAFEPGNEAYLALRSSIRAEKGADYWGRRVFLEHLAVCEKTGRETFYVPGKKYLNATLCPADDKMREEAEEVEVHTTSLAEFQVYGYDGMRRNPDFIFCDAEGAEERIFLGSRLFERCRPIVSLEFTPSRYQTPRALVSFFRDLGYVPYGCAVTGELREVDPLAIIANNEWSQLVLLPERKTWRSFAKPNETRHHDV